MVQAVLEMAYTVAMLPPHTNGVMLGIAIFFTGAFLTLAEGYRHAVEGCDCGDNKE